MSTAEECKELLEKAQSQFRKKNIPESKNLFQKTLELDDQNVSAHMGLATILFSENNMDDALKHFQKAADFDPSRGSALINMGAIYNRLEQYDKAVKVLSKAVHKERSTAQGYYNLGMAHRKLGQLSMAVSAYREAVHINPEMAEAHQNLANVFVDMKNYQQAIKHYQDAIELRPDFERAKLGLEFAEKSKLEASKMISPFGRLVDTAKAGKAIKTQQTDREFTNAERMQDRNKLFELSTGIITDVNKYALLLRDKLDASLEDLGHDLSSDTGRENTISWEETLTEFRSAIQQCHEIRRQMKRKINELRAHEELIKSPDLKLP